MNKIIIILIIATLRLWANAGVIVHNSRKEIDACKGMINLKLLRTWGGDDEKDENKFFKTPSSVAIDKNGRVYICDRHDHCIKVFSTNGGYIRTIGRRGQGPGDLLGPGRVMLAPDGDVLVLEYDGFRIQRFSPEGKSKKIMVIPRSLGWAGITSKNEIALYSWLNTFLSKRIIAFIDAAGRTTREIGFHNDQASGYIDSEKLWIAIDDADQFYVANAWTPVIRKYVPGGELELAITFETPFSDQARIKLNPDKTEIEIQRTSEGPRSFVKKDRTGNAAIDRSGEQRIDIFKGIAVDAGGRIYVISPRRTFLKEETAATRISGNADGLNRSLVEPDLTKNIDVYQLLVFDNKGKIYAEAHIPGTCDDIYIHGNKLFIIDGYVNQRILEFEINVDGGDANPK